MALWGFVAERDGAIVVGLVVAVLGRQTAVPVAVATGLVLAVQRRYRVAVAAAALPALLGPVVCACVGPVTAGPFRQEGIPVIEPTRARLGALVKEIAEQVPRRRR